MKRSFPCFIFLSLLIAGCKHEQPAGTGAETADGTPVTVTGIASGPLDVFVSLPATSTFLIKTTIQSNTTGYIQFDPMPVGKMVSTGTTLFTVKTKEAGNLENILSATDTTFHFKGIVNIQTKTSGFISSINVQPGDYVKEGDPLVTISDAKSFVFILNVPYEYDQFISTGQSINLQLPDKKFIKGTIIRKAPQMDMNTQTLEYQIGISSGESLPENLMATAELRIRSITNSVSLPKAAVLADETMEHFWVMKLINDSTAVRVNIQKGVETGDRVEIISPAFNSADSFIMSGNYGLPDTAKVVIQKEIN